MRWSSIHHIFPLGYGKETAAASLIRQAYRSAFSQYQENIVAISLFVAVMSLAVVEFGCIYGVFRGWLSISGRRNPALTTTTVFLGLQRYAKAVQKKAELVCDGKQVRLTVPDSDVVAPLRLKSVTLQFGNGNSQWMGHDPDCLITTAPLRVHEIMISIIQKFLTAIFAGYLTYVITAVPFVFVGLLGSEWRLFEIVWLNFNGLYGLLVAGCTAANVLAVADMVTDYLMIKTVSRSLYEERVKIEGGSDADAEKFRDEIAKEAIKGFLGFDPVAILKWKYFGAESPALEGLDSAFGQIIVVEFSVIFIVVVLATWAALSGGEDVRQINIQDCINAGAILAWLLVVGLSLSACIASWGAKKRMRSLLSEARRSAGIQVEAVLTPEEWWWRIRRKRLGDVQALSVVWKLQPALVPGATQESDSEEEQWEEA